MYIFLFKFMILAPGKKLVSKSWDYGGLLDMYIIFWKQLTVLKYFFSTKSRSKYGCYEECKTEMQSSAR